MKTGGENLQQVYNRGFDFILNTYGSAENIIPSKNVVPILSRGIVIEVDFNNQKNYKLAAAIAPFSVYAKIIGEDLDVAQPQLQTEKIFYAPLLPMNNLCIPEIGEEVLILRESNEISSMGYYIGRVNNTPGLGYYPARQYMDDQNSITSPEFKYGFSFEADKLRAGLLNKLPSDELEIPSIPLTYGDVVQQGRSQTYIRHSFNRNNKKGVLEQGLCLQKQNTGSPMRYDIALGTEFSYDPSIGKTATKTIHFADTSIKRLGDFSLKSKLHGDVGQNNLDSGEEKSMIVNMADEIYDISTRTLDTTLYRQVLGEKLVSHQQETNDLISSMLNGLTGLAETTQLLLDAFVEHTHAIPKIELNLEKTVTASDVYRAASTMIQPAPRSVQIPSTTVRVQTGTRMVPAPSWLRGSGYGATQVPVFSDTTIPGKTIMVNQPQQVIPGKLKTRKTTQKINFEAIIGGAENPRFTAPIQTDTETPESRPLAGAPEQNILKTDLGLKTAEVDDKSEELINLFNVQQSHIVDIISRTSDFLSKNQFIN